MSLTYPKEFETNPKLKELKEDIIVSEQYHSNFSECLKRIKVWVTILSGFAFACSILILYSLSLSPEDATSPMVLFFIHRFSKEGAFVLFISTIGFPIAVLNELQYETEYHESRQEEYEKQRLLLVKFCFTKPSFIQDFPDELISLSRAHFNKLKTGEPKRWSIFERNIDIEKHAKYI